MAKILTEKNHLEEQLEPIEKKFKFWRNVLIACFPLFFFLGPLVFPGVLLSLIFLNKHYKQREIYKSGLQGEQWTEELFTQLPDTYTVLGDLSIFYEGKISQLDHVVVGPNGVFVIETKNLNGQIIGQEDDRELVQHKVGRRGGEYSNKLYNPLKQVGTHVYRLSSVLKENSLRTWVQGIVLFSNPEAEVSINSRKIPVFSHYEQVDLLRYILDFKGDELSDEKREKIVQTIIQHK